MRIEVDLTSIPAIASLADPEDFERLEVVVARPSHATIRTEELQRLAGAHADEPQWQSNFKKMLAYADSKDWIEADGTVRVHIEWKDPGPA